MTKRVNVKIYTIIVDKRFKNNKTQLNRELAIEINKFFESISDYMNEFEKVVIYYDNGQVEVSKLLSSVFNAFLANPIFRKVMPSDYKLFQVADFICTMELVTLKLNNKLFSKSEGNNVA